MVGKLLEKPGRWNSTRALVKRQKVVQGLGGKAHNLLRSEQLPGEDLSPMVSANSCH